MAYESEYALAWDDAKRDSEDEVACLRSENEALRAALEQIALNCDPNDLPWADAEVGRKQTGDIARAALAAK